MQELERTQQPASPMRRLVIALAGSTLVAGLLGAAPARADGAFEHGFEDELGRIVAHEAAGAARTLLVHGAPLYPVRATAVVHTAHVRPVPYARGPVHAVRHGRWVKWHPHWGWKAHRHGRHDHDRYDRHDRKRHGRDGDHDDRRGGRR